MTVLVVEDEADQRQLITVYLQRAGCTVIATENAEAGLDRSDEVGLDLGIVDLRLPGMSGWALVAELQTRHPHMPIVVTSVLDETNYPSAHMTLPKPYTSAQLRSLLQQLVPRWSAP